MKYLPILQELFESDTIAFLIIGIAIAHIIGLRFKSLKRCIIAIIVSAAIYFICEILSNVHTNYLLELFALFIGTTVIGCFIGFLICFLIRLIKNIIEKN